MFSITIYIQIVHNKHTNIIVTKISMYRVLNLFLCDLMLNLKMLIRYSFNCSSNSNYLILGKLNFRPKPIKQTIFFIV